MMLLDTILTDWVPRVIAVASVIVALTPNQVDNAVLAVVRRWLKVAALAVHNADPDKPVSTGAKRAAAGKTGDDDTDPMARFED